MGKKFEIKITNSLFKNQRFNRPPNNTLDQLLKSETNKKNKKTRYSTHVFGNFKWSKKQTINFYKLLQRYGTDFSTMAFQYNDTWTSKVRTKKELLSKYKRQQKINQEKISSIFDKAWRAKAFGEEDEIYQNSLSYDIENQFSKNLNQNSTNSKSIFNMCIQEFKIKESNTQRNIQKLSNRNNQ